MATASQEHQAGPRWERRMSLTSDHLVYRVEVSRIAFMRAEPEALARFERALTDAIRDLVPDEPEVIDATCVEDTDLPALPPTPARELPSGHGNA